jgi:Na+/H+-dicarboxylate symporter
VKFWFAIPLWQRVVGALILGLAVGLFWGPGAEAIKWIGDLFIRAIRMLVVPLIFFSLVAGVVSIGDLRKLGGIGGRAIAIFLMTGLIAVLLGLLLGNIIQPGAGLVIAPTGELPEAAAAPPGFVEMIVSMVPPNIVDAMANMEVLPMIVFAILFGIAILMAGEAGAPIGRAMDAGAIVMQKMTAIVMELTPFGVFALMAWVAGTYGIDALLPLAKLVAALYIGCLIMILVVYGGIVKLVARVPARHFYRGVADAMAVAYSTSSSAATLPVTLRVTQQNLGISRRVSSFVVSLGATVNMDGTALYLGLAAVFGAQIFGIALAPMDYVLIVVTATLGSIGAAGIPSAGLVMMGLVFTSVGIPLETIAFVAGIDRIMDMMRTTTNVTGDCTVSLAVAKMTDEIDLQELVSADDV